MQTTFFRTRALPWLRAERGHLLALFFGVLVPLYLFGMLAEDVIEQQSIAFDNALLTFVHGYATPQLDRAMLFFSLIGSARVLIPANLMVFGLLMYLRKWAAGLFWIFAVGGAALIDVLAKHSFARTRPSLWISLAPEATYSFPSGHAMESMAVATGVIVLLWKTSFRWPALVLGTLFVLLVSASRVYLGVHYPTDIAAAWVASAAWVIGLLMLFKGRLGHKHGVSNVHPTTTSGEGDRVMT